MPLKYFNLQHTSWPFQTEKFFPKVGIDLYVRVDIQMFTSEESTTETQLLNNRYTPLTVIPANSYKHFRLKLVFGEYIHQINLESGLMSSSVLLYA